MPNFAMKDSFNAWIIHRYTGFWNYEADAISDRAVCLPERTPDFMDDQLMAVDIQESRYEVMTGHNELNIYNRDFYL